MKKYISVGYSGHAFIMLDAVLSSGIDVAGYLEREEKQFNPFKLPYLGTDKEFVRKSKNTEYSLALGIGDNKTRAKLYYFFKDLGYEMPPVIDKFSFVSQLAKIGDASLIVRGSIMNALSEVGTASIVNTGSVIEHECKIGDFVHVAPGAVLLGNVSVGDYSFVGANSVIKQGINVGKKAVVGAGSVVIHDIPPGEVWAGNPAKPLNGHER